MRYLLIIFGLFVLPVQSQEIHSKLCLYGCPYGVPQTNDLIIREIYLLSSNDKTKFADWVAYKITPDSIGKTKGRSWQADPYLDDNETLEPNDYRNANKVLKVDRGHQVPLASFTNTPYWEDTNYLSNITPQKTNLNQGSWLGLESAERDLVKSRNNAVYVMSGPLYESNIGKLPKANEPATVPSGYWKIVAFEENGVINASAFIFQQILPKDADYCEQQKKIKDISIKTGLTFFHEPKAVVKEINFNKCP